MLSKFSYFLIHDSSKSGKQANANDSHCDTELSIWKTLVNSTFSDIASHSWFENIGHCTLTAFEVSVFKWFVD